MGAGCWCPCTCPQGVFPSCGMQRQCGPWERRARQAGIEIIVIEGLTHPRVLTHAGCPPLFYLPAWARGPIREYILGFMAAEVSLRAYGEEVVMGRLRDAVPMADLRETG